MLCISTNKGSNSVPQHSDDADMGKLEIENAIDARGSIVQGEEHGGLDRRGE